MIIAVSGASSSIAKELIAFLESLNHKIIRISSSIPRDGKLFFSFEDLRKNTINCSVDIFFHLASLNTSLNENNINEEVELTETTLAAMHSLNCKKLIFFSTSKIYGANTWSETILFTEDSILQPICAYGKAKQLCEELITAKSSELKINAMILRLPPFISQSSSSSLARLLKFIKKGIPIPSLNHGELNARSFISINNIQNLIIAILAHKDFTRISNTYNLADEKAISLNKLLKTYGSIFYKRKLIFTLPRSISSFLVQLPYMQNFLLRLYGNSAIDNSKLKKDLGVKLETTSASLSIIYK
tara:strand:+ start:1342 stop:2247 length:906 start_codon:yes stop_codon:yes gene_type:complete